MEEGRDVDPETLEYLVGQVFYGGRVQRPEDQLVITSILKEVLTISLKIPEDEDSPRGLLTAGGGPGEEHYLGLDDVDHSPSLLDENDEVGLALLFPDYIGKLDDLQEFVKVRIVLC